MTRTKLTHLPAAKATRAKGGGKLSLSKLNERQREAVLHGEGPLLVLAGAGSGKTSTMAYRIAYLMSERQVPGSAILGLSFTNKAAGELKERVSGLVTGALGPRSTRELWITTFHSLCVRILRAHGKLLGFQPNFTILDEHDQKDLLKQIFRNVKIDERKFDLDLVLFQIGQAKNRLMRPEEAERYFFEQAKLSTDYAIAAATSYGKYQEQLRLLNAMDFDDLLFNAVELLERHPEASDHYNDRFRFILVDEYQDTNPTQFRLLELLTRRRKNITVVGDDDQSIYSWRGADAAHILEFERHYPGARVITLDQNYRSTSLILDAANAVIAKNKVRHPKSLWSDKGRGEPLTEIILEDDRAEGEWVAKEIFQHAERFHRPWKDYSILYRSNAQSRIFEEALRRHRIPYKIVGGMSFLDRKEVKDTLSYWRLALNFGDDPSLRRVINWPARGIGKSTIEALGTFAFQKGVTLGDALTKTELGFEMPAKGAVGARTFVELMNALSAELHSAPPTPQALAEWGRRSLDKIGVKKALEEESEDPVQFSKKWEIVEELVHSMGQLGPDAVDAVGGDNSGADASHLLKEYLARMMLEAQDKEDDEKDKREDDTNQVTLLTLHGAKGMEYPVVFLVGMEEGFLPHKRTIEEAQDFSEERRLAYVGITRAKEHLLLTRARNRIRYGKPVPRLRSRFVQEIPSELLVLRDESHGPDHTDSQEARDKHETMVKDYLSNIRAMLSQGKSP